jgi:predicted ATPase
MPKYSKRMLKRLAVRGFKSLIETSIKFPRLTVLFGPNAAGKSNLLDAVQALSRVGTMRTLSDALSAPIRGYPIEAFAFPAGGLPELLEKPSASFSLEADLSIDDEDYRYRIEVAIAPDSWRLSVADEYLAQLTAQGEPRGNPTIQRVGEELYIRRKGKPAHPRQEPLGLNHAILSDARLGGEGYHALEQVRKKLSGWRVYYLDPRVAMRAAQPPSEVHDIGVLGSEIAPFLYRLRAEHPRAFQAVVRTLRALIPSVEDLTVDLDKRRGTLDIFIRQAGVDYSVRVVSEGTLRVLALCAIAVNPWSGSLLAFEEPENGVHPRRLELIAQLLASLALEQGKQLIITTHSPLFCSAMLKIAREDSAEIKLFNVRRVGAATVIKPFEMIGPLLEDSEIAKALTASAEDGLFEGLILRGLIDE